MFKHILQFYTRVAISAAIMGFFAIKNDWDVVTWLGAALIITMVIYLLDTWITFLQSVD